MSIQIIHGDNTPAAYEYFEKLLSDIKKKGFEILVFEEKGKRNLAEILSAQHLFEKKRVVVVTNLSKVKKADLDWITKNKEINLIVFSNKKLSKTTLKAFPGAKEKDFPVPKLLFKFIDSFYPGNCENCLRILHEMAISEPLELAFSLLARQLRDVYVAGIDPNSLGYPEWRMKKLISHREKFSEDGIKSIIGKLAEIDVVAKSGGRPLLSSLDLLILTELK